MGRRSKAQIAEEKGFRDIIETIVNKVNGIMEGYGEVKDTAHVVMELAKDEEVMELVKKFAGNKDPKMYILLTAAILRVLKNELEDNDGVFDYKPAE